jgi:hypothetical protein
VIVPRANPPAITPPYKISAFYRSGPDLTKEFLRDKGKGIKDKTEITLVRG